MINHNAVCAFPFWYTVTANEAIELMGQYTQISWQGIQLQWDYVDNRYVVVNEFTY